MPSGSRPLPHPAKAVLIRRRILLKEAAAHIGISPAYLTSVLHKRWKPSARITAGLEELLGLPADQLFDEVLVAEVRR